MELIVIIFLIVGIYMAYTCEYLYRYEVNQKDVKELRRGIYRLLREREKSIK